MIGKRFNMYAHALPRCVARAALALGLGIGMGACTTTGHRFDPCGVARLRASVSTYAEAVAQLGSLPVATYIQGDDSFVAHWYVRDTVLPDALYLGREVSLLFDDEGRFLRLANGRQPRECVPVVGPWL